eukprot:COSAG03_NODE_19773_length_330_cov_0.891775_1_plen_66_part_10
MHWMSWCTQCLTIDSSAHLATICNILVLQDHCLLYRFALMVQSFGQIDFYCSDGFILVQQILVVAR